MEFEHLVTLLALVLGPTGIWFGWFLSERSATNRARRDAEEADRLQRQQRVLAIIRLAHRVEADGRDLGHAAYSRQSGRPYKGEQHDEIRRSFNEARAELADQVAEAHLLGPAWVVAPALELKADGQELVEIVSRMESRLTNADVDQIQERVTQMQGRLEDLVTEATKQLTSGSAAPP
jgi:hypothetical protein